MEIQTWGKFTRPVGVTGAFFLGAPPREGIPTSAPTLPETREVTATAYSSCTDGQNGAGRWGWGACSALQGVRPLKLHSRRTQGPVPPDWGPSRPLPQCPVGWEGHSLSRPPSCRRPYRRY